LGFNCRKRSIHNMGFWGIECRLVFQLKQRNVQYSIFKRCIWMAGASYENWRK
jgi:hypothetical protein